MRRHLIVLGLLLGPVAAAQTPAARPAAGLELTYLANEGVLLSSGDRQVILDGLFRFYRNAFPLAPDSVRAALEHARPPFDGIDLVLVTHRHGDHFHPTDVARHLEANCDAILLTSAQVIDSLRGSLTDPARTAGRLPAPVVAAGGRHREVVNGITVDLPASRTGRPGNSPTIACTWWSWAESGSCTWAMPTWPRSGTPRSASIPPGSTWRWCRSGCC